MDLYTKVEGAECCVCGKEHEVKQDFACIMVRREVLYFCTEHAELVENLQSHIRTLLETFHNRKIRKLGVQLINYKKQLKIF